LSNPSAYAIVETICVSGEIFLPKILIYCSSSSVRFILFLVLVRYLLCRSFFLLCYVPCSPLSVLYPPLSTSQQASSKPAVRAQESGASATINYNTYNLQYDTNYKYLPTYLLPPTVQYYTSSSTNIIVVKILTSIQYYSKQ
jgi:hypothetical protein